MGYSRKVVHPPHRGMKNCFNIFLEFQTILHEISSIPKTNREIGHRGNMFKEENDSEFQGEIRKQGIEEHHSKTIDWNSKTNRK